MWPAVAVSGCFEYLDAACAFLTRVDFPVPEAEPAHAVKMARFAWDCMVKMREITRDLECQLGPDVRQFR